MQYSVAHAAAGLTYPSQTNNCIAVIGDGAITGGMAWEAMNCASYLNTRMIVILNENGQVCSTPFSTSIPYQHLAAVLIRCIAHKFVFNRKSCVSAGVPSYGNSLCCRNSACRGLVWIHFADTYFSSFP